MTRLSSILLWAVVAAAAIPAGAADQADPYAAVLSYKFDQPRTATMAIETQIHAAKPAELRAIETKLLALLASPAATTDCKDWACRQLRLAGSEASVGALAPLLADKELATAARLALQSIPGAKVDAALRDSLAKLSGNLKVGAILTIGARGDQQAVALLAPLAVGQDPAIAAAALFALGQIGGADALAAVESAKVPEGLADSRWHAMLRCAESLAAQGKPAEAAAAYHAMYQQAASVAIQNAALRGIVATDKSKAIEVLLTALKSKQTKLRLPAAALAAGLGETDVLPVLNNFAALPTDVRVTILGLVCRKSALPAVLQAAKSDDPAVRVAALGALGRVGDTSAVPLLLGIAAAEQGESQAAARKSLEELRTAGLDATLMSGAEQGAPAARAEAIRLLAARNAVAAVPTLLKAAEDGEVAVQAEALAALGSLADAKSLPALVKLFVAVQEARRAAAEKAILAICRRMDDKEAAAACVLAALPEAGSQLQPALLGMLARIPSAKSLQALRAAAGSAEAAVRDAAIRGLAQWPDAIAMPDLVAIARTAQVRAHKVLALRGLTRLATLPRSQPTEQTVKLLAEAMTLATGLDEKRLVLAALGDVAHPAALELASASLSDPQLEVEAATAVVKAARQLRKSNPDLAGAAIRKVLDTCKSPAARQLAESASFVLGNMVNIAPQGTASSPGGLKKDGGAGDEQAAIDDNPETYWDKEDHKNLYRFVVTFKKPERVAALSILGYAQHSFSPKDFEVLCDGKCVKKVQNAQYDDNFLVVRLDEQTCTTVELKITGYYGGSPAIRELGIFRPLPAKPGK